MPVRRSKLYVGAGGGCQPSQLDELERTGDYVAEPKWDGMFASVEVGLSGNVLRSRDTVDGRIIDGDRAGGIDKLVLPMPGTAVIGELEAASQAATEAVEARGYRKMFVYDVLMLPGEVLTQEPWWRRRGALEHWYSKLSVEAKRQVELTPYRKTGFRAFFEEVMAAGGEGLIIKDAGAGAVPTRLDGKIDSWFKCKVEKTFDYVLVGETLTKKCKSRTGSLGLWDEKTKSFRACLVCGVPESLLKPENYGKVVVEVVAFQRFKSGSARSARFVRVRTDRDALSVVAEQVG